MERRTTVGQEMLWFVVSLVALVLFVPTAVTAFAAPGEWTAGWIDLASGQAEVPTWFSLGMNCILVLVAAVTAVLTGALLVRRLR